MLYLYKIRRGCDAQGNIEEEQSGGFMLADIWTYNKVTVRQCGTLNKIKLSSLRQATALLPSDNQLRNT